MPSVRLKEFFAKDSSSACSAYSAVHLQFLDLKFQISNLRFYQNSHSKR